MKKLWQSIERYFEMNDDPLPTSADAIIAIGCDVSVDGMRCSPMSAAVAEKSYDLYLQGKAPMIIFSGGYHHRKDHGMPSEASVMHALICDRPTTVVSFLEECSYRTYHNANNTLVLTKSISCRSVIVVAQQWHARRVRSTFKKRWTKSGIRIYVVKAHSTYGECSQKRLRSFLTFLVWDTLAFMYGKIRGYN